jgi:hypothetical protein
MQKDDVKDIRARMSAAGRQRVEDEVNRLKIDKEVSRLNGEIKAMLENDR